MNSLFKYSIKNLCFRIFRIFILYYFVFHTKKYWYYLMTLYCTPSFILHCIKLYFTAFYSFMLQRNVLWCNVYLLTVLYFKILIYTILHYTLMYLILFHSTISQYDTLYCIVLYSNVLFCIILHCSVPNIT